MSDLDLVFIEDRSDGNRPEGLEIMSCIGVFSILGLLGLPLFELDAGPSRSNRGTRS